MARKRKSGDSSYNARRREYRAAQRYLKKAEQSSGATAAKNRALAKMHFENALETYDVRQNQPYSSAMINLGANLGIDIQGLRTQARIDFESKTVKEQSKVIEQQQQRINAAAQESFNALESTLKNPQKRSELEAQALIGNEAIGKRIMGGLVDIWRDKVKKGQSAAENRKAAEQAIFEYFGTDNWIEVLEKLEQNIGSDLFAVGNELEIYDVVRIGIQKGVTGNTLIA